MLHVEIYRTTRTLFGAPCDCTNGGISAMAKGLTLVNVPGHITEPNTDYPAAMLVKHAVGGVVGKDPSAGVGIFGDEIGRRLIRIVPATREGDEWKPIPAWCMFGGNYAGASDSRFRQACETILGVFFNGAVPIHDRVED